MGEFCVETTAKMREKEKKLEEEELDLLRFFFIPRGTNQRGTVQYASTPPPPPFAAAPPPSLSSPRLYMHLNLFLFDNHCKEALMYVDISLRKNLKTISG